MNSTVTHLVSIVDDNTNACVSGAGAVEMSCSPPRRSTRPVADLPFEKNLRIVSPSIIEVFGQVYIELWQQSTDHHKCDSWRIGRLMVLQTQADVASTIVDIP